MHQKRDRTCRIYGFTILELLVVMGIIALLASFLFPVFASAREKARQSICFSNQRQIGLAIASYAQDSDDSYPAGVDSKPSFIFLTSPLDEQRAIVSSLPILRDILHPYTAQTDEIWRCPSDDSGRRAGPLYRPDGSLIRLSADTSSYEQINTSYGYRLEAVLLRCHYPATGYKPGNELEEIGSAEVPILTDLSGTWHGNKSDEYDRKFSVLYADGHTRRCTDTQMVGAWLTPLKQ